MWGRMILSAVALFAGVSSAFADSSHKFATVAGWTINKPDDKMSCTAITKQRDLTYWIMPRKGQVYISSEQFVFIHANEIAGKAAIIKAPDNSRSHIGTAQTLYAGKIMIKVNSESDFKRFVAPIRAEWGYVEIDGRQYDLYMSDLSSVLSTIDECNKAHGLPR